MVALASLLASKEATAHVQFLQKSRHQVTSFKYLAFFLLALSCTSTVAANAVERKFIRKRMGEGEVILKIGKPDHEAFNRIVRGEAEEKTWTYFPYLGDSQTITILKFESGVVISIDRKIAR